MNGQPCLRGHDDWYRRPSDGRRYCRACNAERQRTRRMNRRARTMEDVWHYRGEKWRLQAACARGPMGAWDSDAPEHLHRVAISMCGYCPVSGPCLAWGLAHSAWGIWGGMPMRNGTPASSRSRSATA